MKKRLFISFFIFYLVAGFVVWGTFIFEQFSYAFLGAFLSAFSGVIYFIGIYTFDRSSNNIARTKYYGFINYAGLLLVVINLTDHPEPLHYVAGFYAGLNLVMWDKYVRWYSVYGERNVAVKIDKKLPAKGNLFLNGEEIAASSICEKPAVWIFYRGNWCPFCVAHINEVVAKYQEISALGFQINFVSTQNETHTKSLGDKFGLEANFLFDKDGTFSSTLGMTDPTGLPFGLEVFNYQSPVLYPAIIITDKNGVVRFFDVTDNYRDRMAAELILEELRRFGNA